MNIPSELRMVLSALQGLLFLCMILTGQAIAQQVYPSRLVKVIIPFAPGGGTDQVARYVSGKLSGLIGQQFIVENKDGAGGILAGDLVARSAPDGYTISLSTSSYAVNAVIVKSKLTFDPVGDIAPISQVAAQPLIVIVNANSPIRTIHDLIAQAKAAPGKLNYASAGYGALQHLSAEQFKLVTKTDLTHIAYKGSGPALTDLIAGRVDVFWGDMVSSIPQMKAGKVMALGVTSNQRVASVPDVPTVMESVPGYEINHWYFMYAPKATPAPIISFLNGRIGAVLDMQETKDLFFKQGITPQHSTPADMRDLLVRRIADLNRVVTETNMKIEQ